MNGRSISVVSGDEAPACYVDNFHHVYLRGHFTMSNIPQSGEQLVAALPLSGHVSPSGPSFSCPCSPPATDPVVYTSTGLVTYHFTFPDPLLHTDVCIIRLLVTRSVFLDLDNNNIINAADENVIVTHPLFQSTTSCGDSCGKADINHDGFVSAVDLSILRNSTTYPLDVSCGIVEITAFSCGQSRHVPGNNLPCDGISLNVVEYPLYSGMAMSKRRNSIDLTLDSVKNALLGLVSQSESIAKRVEDPSFGDANQVLADVGVVALSVFVCGALLVAISKKR